MTITKLATLALTSLMLTGTLANGVSAATFTQEDCDLALHRELRQICTPQTPEDVLKTTWPGGTNLGTPCYAAADAYFAAVMAKREDTLVTTASAKFCEHLDLGRTE